MKPPATPEGACHSPTRPSPAGGAAGLHQGARSPARVTAGVCPVCQEAGAERRTLGVGLEYPPAPALCSSSVIPRMIEYKLDLLDELIENLGKEPERE